MDTNEYKLTPEEEALISEAYHKYHTELYLYVSSFVNDPYAVEDIISDTFTLACKKISLFKLHENQKGWLISVAKNKIREMRRKLERNKLFYAEDTLDEVPSSSSQYATNDIALDVKITLTPEEHLRFLRYFIWGYKLQEMADIEGTTLNNMSVRLSRIRKKLIELL